MREDKELASQSQPSPTPESAGHDKPSADDWRPIASVPRDGQTVQLRQMPWAPFHGWYHGWELHPIQYLYSAKPTHWRP